MDTPKPRRHNSHFAMLDWRLITAEHCQAIGPALWLYALFIRRADFDTLTLAGYTDADASADLGQSRRVIRDWRERLQDAGYIGTVRRGNTLTITINRAAYAGEAEELARTDAGCDTRFDTGCDTSTDTGFDIPAQRRGVNPSISTETEKQKNRKLETAAPDGANAPAAADASVLSNPSGETDENPHYIDNLFTLRQVGIIGKTAEALARLPHVHPELIELCADDYKTRAHHGNARSTGLLVTLIRDYAEAPYYSRGYAPAAEYVWTVEDVPPAAPVSADITTPAEAAAPEVQSTSTAPAEFSSESDSTAGPSVPLVTAAPKPPAVERASEVLALLAETGMDENARRVYAALPHMTPAFVAAHLEAWRAGAVTRQTLLLCLSANRPAPRRAEVETESSR